MICHILKYSIELDMAREIILLSYLKHSFHKLYLINNNKIPDEIRLYLDRLI